MAEVRTFKVDDKYGVPDKFIREFITKCEQDLGLVRVTLQPVRSETATLVTVVVTKADDI